MIPDPVYTGIPMTLHALSALAWREQSRSELRELAQNLTDHEPDRGEKMRLIVDELHRRFTYAPEPMKETLGPVPLTPGPTPGSP